MNAQFLDQYFEDSSRVILELKSISAVIDDLVTRMSIQLKAGGKIIWFGNGGSASDAQHLSAELMGRFETNRSPISSISLNTDTSLLTAVANDFGYETVFARQIAALCSKVDVCVGITTSGKSKNVVTALQAAKKLGALTVALTGSFVDDVSSHSDVVVSVQSKKTSHIQEAHITIGQAICACLEKSLFD